MQRCAASYCAARYLCSVEYFGNSGSIGASMHVRRTGGHGFVCRWRQVSRILTCAVHPTKPKYGTGWYFYGK